MAPESQTVFWSGTLRSKKKSELQQICRDLRLDFKLDAIKADLEQQIRDRFKEKPSLQTDHRFAKLDISFSPSNSSAPSVAPTGSRRSTRARSVSRPPRGQDEDNSVEDQPIRSPSRRSTAPQRDSDPPELSSGPQKISVTVGNAEKERHHSSFSPPKPVASPPSNPPSQLVKKTSQHVVDTFNSFARCTARHSINAVQAIQTTFSCPWKLCIIATLAELIFVIYSTVPPRQAVFIARRADDSIRVPEPMIRLFNRIFSRSFLQPLTEYLCLSVIAPFVIAGLMNVPRSHPDKNPKENFRASRDLKPSVFVYCATRLAVLALVHLVFYPNHHFGWSVPAAVPLSPGPLGAEGHSVPKALKQSIQLKGLESVQYVSTAFGMVIALHQLIRSSS